MAMAVSRGLFFLVPVFKVRSPYPLLPLLRAASQCAANRVQEGLQFALARHVLRHGFPDLLLKLLFCDTAILWRAFEFEEGTARQDVNHNSAPELRIPCCGLC